MAGFDGNDYRKRVLAVIEARGGVPESDPFEWYDLPLEKAESLKDRAVAEQLEQVWGFWQKQRDHPKYRGLVTALLAVHDELAPQLVRKESRQQLAGVARATREERDEDTFTELDSAVARLVERFGGIPVSKLPGLRAFAAQAGIDEASAERRLSRHRLVKDESAPSKAAASVVPASVYRQVRADLDELGRILGGVAPVSLYDLLGLEPAAPQHQVAKERDLAAARNRELRPDRRRALVDDLLAAVTTLLLDGDPDAYLDAVAEEVTDHLRSRVAAAVLVEDELTAVDHAHLVGEAEAAGLDRERALRVLAGLAKEQGVAVPRSAPTRSPSRHRAAPTALPRPTHSSSAAWHDTLVAARAALRAGQAREAERLVDRARGEAGGTLPPIRAVADEVREVIAEAHRRWQVALTALAARRFSEATCALERLLAIAADVPGPDQRQAQQVWDEARRGLDSATAALSRVEALVGDARELALLQAWQDAPDHPGIAAALGATGVAPACQVRADRVGAGVVIRWVASTSPGPVDYRVQRVDAQGGRQTVGTTAGSELETSLPPGPLPTYLVTARRAGVCSVEALSQVTPPPDPPQVISSLVLLSHGRRVRLLHPTPERGRVEVRRLPPGTRPPDEGATVPDPDALGTVVPAMGPGLAVDRRPTSPTAYVVLSLDGGALAGAHSWYVELPAVSGLREEQGRLRWDWPEGCTEVVVAWAADAPPDRPEAGRKVTNTRYEIDGGFALPPDRPLHVAVFTCTRWEGELLTACEASATARAHLEEGVVPTGQ